MHICNRCEARHKDAAPKCSVCGFKKLTEWKAAASREGVVAISSPALPKDTARIKIGWKNTVKSIENQDKHPRPGRWIAFYIPTSRMPLSKDLEANGFRVSLTIKLLTNGTLRYHGRLPGSDEFMDVKDTTFRLSNLQHGWHYAQVTGSGTEANHIISLELEERAYARYEDRPESKPVIPWTFWYFPFSTARLPVAYLDTKHQEELVSFMLKPIKEKYAKEVGVLKQKRINDEEGADSELKKSIRERLEKANSEILTDEYYESGAETAKENKKKALLEKFNKEKDKVEDAQTLKSELQKSYDVFCNSVDTKLARFKEEAAAKRETNRNNLREQYNRELSQIRTKLDLEFRSAFEKLKIDEEKELSKITSDLTGNDLMSPLITFGKHFSKKNELEDAGKAVAWESNPDNGHCGDKTGWTGHCDAAGFASAMFEEPIDKGIWKAEELKFIVTEYFMSYIVSTDNTVTTWQLGNTESRHDPSHLNFIGYFRNDLESTGEHAKKSAHQKKIAAGKNGAILVDKLRAAISNGMPVVMDMRVDADFSEEDRVLSAQAVWNHCVFCYEVRYREADDATGGSEEMARDLVAHIAIYANKDHSPPTTKTKAATINATDPPDITLIKGNCIIRYLKVRLQFVAKGAIDVDSEKSDWLGCYAERRQTDELGFQYRTERLPPRYLTLTTAKKPIKRPMANPYITEGHIEALVKEGYLKWSKKL